MDSQASGGCTRWNPHRYRNLIKLAFLAAAKLGGPTKVDLSTPLGQRPIYTKPPAPKRTGSRNWTARYPARARTFPHYQPARIRNAR